MDYKPIAREQFQAMLAKQAGEAYANYGEINQQLLGKWGGKVPEDPAA